MSTRRKAVDYTKPIPGRKRALCCECGQVRTLALGYLGTSSEGYHDTAHRDDCRRRRPGRIRRNGESGFERLMADVKCDHCGETTRHAVLRDHDEAADIAELWDHGWRGVWVDSRRETAWRQVRPTAPGLYDGEAP